MSNPVSNPESDVGCAGGDAPTPARADTAGASRAPALDEITNDTAPADASTDPHDVDEDDHVGQSRLGPGPRTRLRRLPEKSAYDETSIFAILDAAVMCHVAGVVDGLAMALPTLHQRVGRTIYVHANASNALLRAVLTAGRAALSVTLYDGLRLARSGFESSIAYRSVVVVGATREVVEASEKQRVLVDFVDAVLPGRASEVRPMTERERNLTLVVAIAIEEASAKISTGPTDDGPEDRDLAIWAGSVPARLVYGEPVPQRDGAMTAARIELPPSLRRLREHQGIGLE